MPLVSIIIPVFNEEENIDFAYSEVCQAFSRLSHIDLEILFVDNLSLDRSWNHILELAKLDPRVRGLRYSRNFGYQRSIYQAHMECRGAAAITLDCDMQDDPRIACEFIEEWLDGHRLVLGRRRTRAEGLLITSLRKFFYRAVFWLSDGQLPVDVGEFRLLDREIIEHLRRIGDHQPYFRGLVASLGFCPVYIDYDRAARTRGKSKFSMVDLFRIAADGALNFSSKPLRVSLYFGLILSFFCFLASLIYAAARIFFGEAWPSGFTTLTVLVLFGIGLNGIFLGVIGEYVGRIYRQLKIEPIAIVMDDTAKNIVIRPDQSSDRSVYDRVGKELVPNLE